MSGLELAFGVALAVTSLVCLGWLWCEIRDFDELAGADQAEEEDREFWRHANDNVLDV